MYIYRAGRESLEMAIRWSSEFTGMRGGQYREEPTGVGCEVLY